MTDYSAAGFKYMNVFLFGQLLDAFRYVLIWKQLKAQQLQK